MIEESIFEYCQFGSFGEVEDMWADCKGYIYRKGRGRALEKSRQQWSLIQ
jgi:hypothetical protein